VQVGLLLLALLAVLLFLWLAHMITHPQVAALDADVVRRVAALRTTPLDGALLLVTNMGDPWIITVLLVVSGLALLRARRWLDGLAVALAGGGAWLLTESLKLYYQRARPALVPTPLEMSGYSFPSGHTLGAMVGYGMVLFIALRVVRWPRLRALLLLLLPAMIVLIGASRVYFAVHFPTDVLAGFLVGTAWLLLVVQAVWIGERYRASRSG
jgi:undecaprenyl-diphosphatase